MPDSAARPTDLPPSIDLDIVQEAFLHGLARATDGLAAMVGRGVRVVDPEVSVVAPAEVTRFVGVPDGPMVGIALGLTGPFVAHVVLLMEPANALSLVDLLMGQESGTAQEVDAMSESALGEVGNIMGSFFATVVADLTRLTLWSTTPVVHLDTARALIDALVAPPGRPIRQVLVISTRFEQHPVSGHGRVSGIFVVLPDAGGMDVLLNALRAEAG